VRLALVIVAALALAVPAAGAGATVQVTARLERSNVARLSPPGRAGDADSSRWIVRDRHARTIGDMLLDCRWVTADLRLCVGQVSLPLGVIAVLGASRTRFLGELAVVGGTGRYVGANGTLLFSATSSSRVVVSINYSQ
jgi:hypothetical protein